MGFDPLSIGLAVGMGGLSFAQARSSNNAAEFAARQQKAALDIQAAKEKENLAREFAQLEGSLRATSASRGIAGSSSDFALGQSLGYTGVSTQGSIDTSLRLGKAQADQRAAAAYQNPFFSGISGGLQGFLLGSKLSTALASRPTGTSDLLPNPRPQRLI